MSNSDKSLEELRRNAFKQGCAPAAGVLTATVSAIIIQFALTALGIQWLWNDFVVNYFSAAAISFKQALVIYVLFDGVGASYRAYQIGIFLKENDPERDPVLEAFNNVLFSVTKLVVIAAFVAVF